MVMEKDRVQIIEANIDDMSPQIYEYLLERLMAEGALDAYLQNIIMKKGRPAVKVSVICEGKDTKKLSEIILGETTTIGVRILDAERLKLPRKMANVKTKYGQIPVKISKGVATWTITPEYDACVKIARQKKVPLRKVICAAKDAAELLG